MSASSSSRLPTRLHLAELTTDEISEICERPPCAVLLPLGSVEPHGPHLPLATDTVISEAACARAARMLAERGVAAFIAPSIPSGVTDFAAGFRGAVGVPADALTAFARSVAGRFVDDGWTHVCLVNNHLEPAQDAAVRAAISGFPRGVASVACPLTRRWGRMLSDEFKRGDCHAGRYETSLAIAAGAEVREEFASLPAINVSLSDEIRNGKRTFHEMGLVRAYTGSPAHATREEGDALYELLAHMITTEVLEGIAATRTA
jgi:creatinine amidohydrolase